VIVVMIQSVRNYAHDVNREFKKEFVDCSTVSLREAQRRGNPADAQGNPRIAFVFLIAIPTGLPRPSGLAMTAKRDAFENRNEPSCTFPSHLCPCEEHSDAAIQREHRVITPSVRHPA
jgi:hypothetical protein